MTTVFNDVTVTSPCQLQSLVKDNSVIFKCSDILYKSTGIRNYLLMQKILYKYCIAKVVYFVMLLHDQLMISLSYA